MEETTDFGFTKIPITEKTNLVGQVFNSVANKYDLMNDLMSLGIHRLWKKIAVQHCGLHAGQTILDLAGGTGDLTAAFARTVTQSGIVVLADINQQMLQVGRHKLVNQGLIAGIKYLQLNAESLALPSDYFDCVAIGFGLRNVTHKDVALQEIYRVLKPGGRIVILEFSKPIYKYLQTIYDVYSFQVLPLLGKLVANDAASYQYLAESIRMHPDQQQLKSMLETAGFVNCNYLNLSAGICAIYKGFKI